MSALDRAEGARPSSADSLAEEDIQGHIQFSNDTEYWQNNSFDFLFQNVTSFFKLGGEDVWIYGGRASLAIPLFCS